MTSKERFSTGIFIIPCIVITGLLMLLAGSMGQEAGNPASAFAAETACLVPALTAIVLCAVEKTELEDTRVLPRFREAVWWYALAILIAMALSLLGDPLKAFFFPEIVNFDKFDPLDFLFGILAMIGFSLPSVLMVLGEEFGWLGYLFPRLEKKYGVITAVVIMALVRGVWHLVMLMAIGGDGILLQFVTITVNNLLLDSVLVYVTKRSGSIIPAALIHTLSNGLAMAYASFITVDEAAYKEHGTAVWLVEMIPCIMIGMVCYWLLGRGRVTVNSNSVEP